MPVRRSGEGRATTAARCAQVSTSPLAASRRIASRTGVRDTAKRLRELGFVERDAGRQRAAHDLVGQLQAQRLGQRLPSGRLVRAQRQNAHAAFGSSIRLTCAATTCQPSGKRTQVCICRPSLPGTVSRRNKVEATAKSRP